jgi:uncharacterized membrane protein
MDGDGLLALARDHDCVIKTAIGIGEFATAGRPLAFVAGNVDPETLQTKLVEHYFIASYRTVHQDAAFGVRQIVDIGLKALSPSVNDVTTAVTCIQYLAAILVRMADRRIPSAIRYSEGKLRVIAKGPKFDEMLGLAFDELRRAAKGDVRILENLICALANIEVVTTTGARKEAVRSQVRKVQAAICADASVKAECSSALATCARILGQSGVPTAIFDGTSATDGASARKMSDTEGGR